MNKTPDALAGTLEAVSRLGRDIKSAVAELGDSEARYLVDAYYIMQDQRKRFANQLRALDQGGEPNAIIEWFGQQFDLLERQVKRALDRYTRSHPRSEWLRSVCGVGPVIAAGLLAHINVRRGSCASSIWKFAGLDPTTKWEKGQKRPHNAKLKTICWHLGESFVKVSNNKKDFYGKIYAKEKARRTEKNLAGGFVDLAVEGAARVGKLTEAHRWYSGRLTTEDARGILAEPDATKRAAMVKKLCGEPGSGTPMLPPAHIHAQAKRKAVKLFLAHLYGDLYEREFGEKPPTPFPVAHLEHVHFIEKPTF